LQSRIIRLAAFQNPDFYKAQAMRMSTFGKPRVISCAEYYSQHIALPRGCQDELISLFDELKIKAVIQDERFAGQDIGGIAFQGQLTDEQNLAVNKLLEHDIGTLSATTAFGKTVVALNILAKRQVNTLIIVHRRQLLDQWLERIELFLNVTKKQVGKIGGGKNKPTGVIDVAIIQSLTKNQSVADLVANYGQVIFDECHHLSAVSFEMVAKACKAKYVLGLSATLTRKDGHHPIVFMQCGAVRHQVSAKKQALARPFEHYVTQRHTVFMTPENNFPVTLSIHDVYQALVVDVERNQFIIEDIKKALAQGRSPLILTERREHVMLLAEQISKFAKNVVVMQGGMGIRQRKQVQDILQNIPDTEERVIIATGRYLGEGFDDARLDTLFLVMPISWKGTLAQYVGRLHRLHHLKTEVRIYDYVDINVPMLSKMSEKRKAGYKALGYTMVAEEL
jgi:superfamily II DNA or RNA helicase